MTTLTNYLNDYQLRVNKALQHYLADYSQPSELHQAMHYALFNGGKRVRPYLIYACGDMLGVAPSVLDACAAAIECIHVYSLVHDDLPAMDDSDLRRGKPSCHVAFDEATAILVGDALQSLAFEIVSAQNFPELAPQQQLKMLHALASACGTEGMAGGQAIDLNSSQLIENLTDLENLHALKTGALFTACIKLTLSATEIDKTSETCLLEFAKHFGLLFQIQDDILDVVSDTASLGKPAAIDAKLDKRTFPHLLGLEQAQKYSQQVEDKALYQLKQLACNHTPLLLITEFVGAQADASQTVNII